MAQYLPTQTAYTQVTARRSFNPTPSTPSVTQTQHVPAPAPHQKAKVEWPDSVRGYVQRAFAVENNISDVPRQEMEVKLKDIIAQSFATGMLHSTDWTTAALPQQIIISERRAAPSFDSHQAWTNVAAALPAHHANSRSLDPSSRKRKSSDLDTEHVPSETVPPWKLPRMQNVFEDRVSYPSKRAHTEENTKHLSKSLKRKQRFEQGAVANFAQYHSDSSGVSSPAPEVDHGPIVGRCQTLEKKYFRLTAPPNPDTVRPLLVLEKTLDLLKKKWKKENNYSYTCDQLKSLRQDLTVQRIKTAFTVNVYELHARIALEKADLGEYNQCQTQLRALYSQHLGGHPEEFKAYRILYFIHTCNRTDMNDVLADLTTAEKHNPFIKHALETRSALALGNYHRFFQLYLETPNMGAYLMDMFVGRERLNALSNICISYKPDVKLRFVTEELGFESDDESARFICDHGGQDFLETKEAGEVRILTSKALRVFEAAKAAAFRRVDIKGQI